MKNVININMARKEEKNGEATRKSGKTKYKLS